MSARRSGNLWLVHRLRTSQRSSSPAFSLIGGLSFALLLGLLLVTSGLAWLWLTHDLPSVQSLPLLLNPQDGLLRHPTRIADRHGNLLQELSPLPGPRRYVSLRELPPLLIQALLLNQDPTFWQHPGFRLQGLTAPELHPTLAQQLVADLLLYQEPPTLHRALRERLLAWQITTQFGRERILEWYLNSADFGQNLIGIAAASEFYLGQSPEDLSPAAALFLAVIPPNPQINPHTLPQETRRQALELLQRLVQAGKLPPEEARPIEEELGRIPFTAAPPPQETPAFLRLVSEQIQASLPIDRFRKGGLTLYTTLDGDLQQQARCLLRLFAVRIAAGPEPILCPQAAALPTLPPSAHLRAPSLAFLILDVPSGEILAAAGETFQGKESSFWSPHPAGTSIDPFVYLTAFTRGWSPASLVWDLPPEGENPEGYLGPMRMRRALANLLPRPTQHLRRELGEAAVERTLSILGLQESRITLPQLATAYATLARSGTYLPPRALLRLESTDHALWPLKTSPPQEVIDPAVTYLVNHVLSDPLARQDTWGYPGVWDLGRPVAVVAGRTSEVTQAWLIAYTPQRLVALWLGSMDGEQVSPQWLGGLARALLEQASRSLPVQDWSPPVGVSLVEVCDPSGLLPSSICPKRVTEVFLSGNEPHEVDSLYRRYFINRETGLLATVFTPPALIEERIYLQVPPQARRWAEAQGWPQPPTVYDPIRLPPPNPSVHITQPVAFEQVSGKVIIHGSATGENFRSYRLLVGQGLNPQEWQLIVSAEAPRNEEPLGEWNTEGLEGIYILQLQVLRRDGTVESAFLPVTVKRK
ncbi:MAG: transglycosylase domain-containing protein [Anaerolineales bacterium]